MNEIVSKLLNQAGAEVHVTKSSKSWHIIKGHGWTCTGCGDGAAPDRVASELTLPDARKAAQRHAGHCRFLSA